MKEMLRYGFILAVVCAVAAGLLAGMNTLTKAKILAQDQAEEEAGLKDVFAQGGHFEAVKVNGETVYYKVHDKEGKFIGAAFKAQGKGYSSTIEVIAGMTKEGKITAIKILSQDETPGLGSRVAEPAFTGQFTDKDVADLKNIQAITGATISSRAVINSVEKRSAEVKELIKNE